MIASKRCPSLQLTLALFAVALMSGCGSEPQLAPEASQTIAGEDDGDEADETGGEAEQSAAERLTSQQVADAFKAAGLPVGTVEIYDASTDPNELLGRPGQYTAKFNFADTRLEQFEDGPTGGSVESFESTRELENRAEYIKSLGESMPMFAEYQFTSGLMLLRLDKGLTPEQADEYANVFHTLGG